MLFFITRHIFRGWQIKLYKKIFFDISVSGPNATGTK